MTSFYIGACTESCVSQAVLLSACCQRLKSCQWYAIKLLVTWGYAHLLFTLSLSTDLNVW